MDDQLFQELAGKYGGRRVLVTGGTGFLGSCLVGLLKDIDCRVIRLARAEATPYANGCRAVVTDVIGDIRKRTVWESALADVDFVFHIAGQTSVSVARGKPLADHEVNVISMLHMLEACRMQGTQPVVLFSGTVTEAGIPSRLPLDEGHPDKPVTMYDLNKLVAENYLKHYAHERIVQGAVLRLANVYGPGPRSGSADRGVMNTMIRRAIKGETLTVYGEGDAVRDYVYVEDVARAFIMAGACIDHLNGQHFVIGSGVGHTLKNAFNLVADRVAIRTGHRVQVSHVEPQVSPSPIESRNVVVDSSRFINATGWRAEQQLSQGIDRTIEGYLCES